MVKIFRKKYALTILGVLLGSLGGFLYWWQVGCSSGTCPITSSPYASAAWGGLIGGLLLNMFEPTRKNKDNKK